MSNSFNISVKPEIAAVKADTADIRTDVTAIHDTNLPAVKTDTADIRTDVTAIHDTDLPGAVTKIDANKDVVDLIRGTDVPNIQTNINANETKIDEIRSSQFFIVLASDTIISEANTERTVVGTTETKVKEIRVSKLGLYRITFDIKGSSASYDVYGAIYKNGVEVGTPYNDKTSTYVEHSEDLLFSPGDLIQLYIKIAYVTETAYARNFKIKGTINRDISTVIQD